MATNRAFSVEDGTLNTRSLVTSRDRVYSDIDLTFTKRPNGDVYRKTDAAAVKQAVRNLITTGYAEKPFNPDFTGGLGNILFENMTGLTELEMEVQIKNAVTNFEPRAIIQEVKAAPNPDRNSIFVRVIFRIASTSETVAVETTLSRLR